MKRSYESRKGSSKKSKYVPTTKSVQTRVPRSLVSVGQQGFPNRLTNQLKYNAFVTVTIAVPGIGSYNFAANGLYDPDLSGVGHQPHYYDQLTALYNHYVVTKSTMKLRLLNLPTNGIAYGIFLDDDNSPSLANRFDAIEREGCVWSTAARGQLDGRTVSKVFNASKYFGPNVVNGSRFTGDITSNPSEMAHFYAWAAGTSTETVEFCIEILYDVQWSELKTVVSS